MRWPSTNAIGPTFNGRWWRNEKSSHLSPIEYRVKDSENLHRPVSGAWNGTPTASTRLPPVFNTGPLVNPGSAGLITFALRLESPSTSTKSPHHRTSYPARFETENSAKRLLLLGAFVYPTSVILIALAVAGVWRMLKQNATTRIATIPAPNPQRL